MKAGIYIIENLINGKKYVGQGINVKNRMQAYHKHCVALNRAIKKYGRKNIKRYIVLYCEECELDYYEMECIRIFHSHVSENGYNLSKGGSSNFGFSHSPESILKMSGPNNHNYGKPMPNEQKEKISKSNMGRIISLDAREKTSKTLMGRKLPPERIKT
jgi:group I intron endonuclease